MAGSKMTWSLVFVCIEQMLKTKRDPKQDTQHLCASFGMTPKELELFIAGLLCNVGWFVHGRRGVRFSEMLADTKTRNLYKSLFVLETPTNITFVGSKEALAGSIGEGSSGLSWDGSSSIKRKRKNKVMNWGTDTTKLDAQVLPTDPVILVPDQDLTKKVVHFNSPKLLREFKKLSEYSAASVENIPVIRDLHRLASGCLMLADEAECLTYTPEVSCSVFQVTRSQLLHAGGKTGRARREPLKSAASTQALAATPHLTWQDLFHVMSTQGKRLGTDTDYNSVKYTGKLLGITGKQVDLLSEAIADNCVWLENGMRETGLSKMCRDPKLLQIHKELFVVDAALDLHFLTTDERIMQSAKHEMSGGMDWDLESVTVTRKRKNSVMNWGTLHTSYRPSRNRAERWVVLEPVDDITDDLVLLTGPVLVSYARKFAALHDKLKLRNVPFWSDLNALCHILIQMLSEHEALSYSARVQCKVSYLDEDELVDNDDRAAHSPRHPVSDPPEKTTIPRRTGKLSPI